MGFKTYNLYAQTVKNNLVGVKTPLGFEIQGFTPHFVGRMIGRSALNHKYNRPGVSTKNLLDCLKNGVKGKIQVNRIGESSVQLISNKCIVSVNPIEKKLIQCSARKLVKR